MPLCFILHQVNSNRLICRTGQEGHYTRLPISIKVVGFLFPDLLYLKQEKNCNTLINRHIEEPKKLLTHSTDPTNN